MGSAPISPTNPSIAIEDSKEQRRANKRNLLEAQQISWKRLPQCGAEILPRRLRGKIVGRARLYCSDRCRKAAFRSTDFARRYPPLGAGRNDKNNPIVSTASDGDFAGRASPEVSGKLWHKVLKAEQPWRGGGDLIISSDGVSCFVVGKLRRSR